MQLTLPRVGWSALLYKLSTARSYVQDKIIFGPFAKNFKKSFKKSVHPSSRPRTTWDQQIVSERVVQILEPTWSQNFDPFLSNFVLVFHYSFIVMEISSAKLPMFFYWIIWWLEDSNAGTSICNEWWHVVRDRRRANRDTKSGHYMPVRLVQSGIGPWSGPIYGK